MTKRIRMSKQTRTNWLIDAIVFAGAVLSMLSGIYFLFIPSGGYQGGRNPMYGFTILFSRHTWDDVHTWGGVLMIAAVVIHFSIHWKWVKLTIKRVISAILSRDTRIPWRVQMNIGINTAAGISFLLCGVSGIYFLFAPSGGHRGGNNPGWDPGLLVSRTTWDLIHTWSGVIFIIAAVIHFAIHWRWVKNVTRRFFLSLLRSPESHNAPAAQSASR